MNADILNHFQAAFDAQMPPHVRYVEPSAEQVTERAAEVRKEWEQDESRTLEMMCEAIVSAKPKTQDALASMIHRGDYVAFGRAALSIFEPMWTEAVKDHAQDELAGIV